MANDNYFEQFLSGVQEELTKMGHVNLIVAGRTGVGKSTLVNAAFREDLAQTGIGRPVTDELRLYEKEGLPLRLYDTVGFELDAEKRRKTAEDIKRLLDDAAISGSTDRRIHGMWYCVLSNSNRVEPAEEEFIREMSRYMPVILVVTQVITKKQFEAFRSEINKMNLAAVNVLPVLAEDYDDDGKIKKAFGVPELIEFTADILPEYARLAFANAEKASLKLKAEQSRAVVRKCVTTAFGEGFIPLPVADATVLVPTQIAMMAKITSIYGISITKNMMACIASTMLGTAGATFTGRTITSNLLKLIPGAGTLVGGTISGATAALVTSALGETYIRLMELIASGQLDQDHLNTDKVQRMIRSMFNKQLRGKKRKGLEEE